MPNKKCDKCGANLTAMALTCDPPVYYDWCQKCGETYYGDKTKRESGWPTDRGRRPLSRGVAALLLEDVLDTLVEVGNGASNEMLRLACSKLFLFRDGYFNQENIQTEKDV